MRNEPKGQKRRVAAKSDRNALRVPPPVLASKNAAAVWLGSAGGRARAKKLGVRRRKEIARQAAAARWKKQPN